MFISFEGLDFCGKSTQIELLCNYLKEKGKEVIIIREPGGTDISEKVREILLDKKNSNMVIETEILLFSSARSQLVREVILPSLEKGYFILSDRFHDSTTAYQGYGRGIALDFVGSLNNFVIEKAVPDLTFFIDISIQEMFIRKTAKNSRELDRIEISSNGFYERVRNGYQKLCDTEKRFVKIDGSESIEIIHKKIINKIEQHEKKKYETI
ncbi:MAG: dTMP kinase [bacterium]